MRSIHTAAADVFNQLGFSNESRVTSLTPGIISSHALQEVGFETSDLSKITEKRQKNHTNIALGVGATAYVLVQIGNFFTENPQTLYTLGEGLHALWTHWESLVTVWNFGNFVGFEHIWSAIEATTHITDLAFGYGMEDLMHGAAHALDVYSLGAAVAATLLTKSFFKWLNKDNKAALDELSAKEKESNRIWILAEQAVSPAFLRNEIAKIGNHHFAY